MPLASRFYIARRNPCCRLDHRLACFRYFGRQEEAELNTTQFTERSPQIGICARIFEPHGALRAEIVQEQTIGVCPPANQTAASE